MAAGLRRIEVTAPGQVRRSKPEEYDHWPATTGTQPVGGDFGLSLRHRSYSVTGWEQLPAKREPLAAESVGEESEMPDSDESLRQDMQEEAAQKLDSVQRHFALLAAMSIILPSEGDALAIERQQAVIRDGDPMRIPAQIA